MPTSEELIDLVEQCASKLELDDALRHVWVQQEGAYQVGLAVGWRLRLRKET